MKLHTNTFSESDLYDLLFQLQDSGEIGDNVFFWKLDAAGSRSHNQAFEVQLGAQDSGGRVDGGKSRRYKNSGMYGGGNVYAATYDEYGAFCSALFGKEPDAKFGKYGSESDFHAQTNFKFAGQYA